MQSLLRCWLLIESVKEKQESELVNTAEYGLLHQAAKSMRLKTRKGPPTPDDLDELITRVWKEPAFFLAHPRAIAAFGRECTRRGVPPPTVTLFGAPMITWRGLPLVPCDKLHVNGKKSDILLMRTGGLGAVTLLAAVAVLIATVNVAGGFLVTQRMLKMFHR